MRIVVNINLQMLDNLINCETLSLLIAEDISDPEMNIVLVDDKANSHSGLEYVKNCCQTL